MLNFKILIVVPVFNNAGTVGNVIKELLKTGYDVLAVNDGSTDGTQEVIDSTGISSIRILENRGKGFAIKTAAAMALKKGYSHIVTIDADGQHDPSDIAEIAGASSKFRESIIIGSRNFAEADVPVLSRIGRFISNCSIFILTGRYISDSQSGFRAYPVRLIDESHSPADRYDFEYGIILYALLKNYSVNSISIKVHYSKESSAASHFRVFMDNLRIIKAFFKTFFRHIVRRD